MVYKDQVIRSTQLK